MPLKPLGLDWVTPLEELENRFGGEKREDGSTIISLPPFHGLSKEPLVFKLYSNPGKAKYPPDSAWAHYEDAHDAATTFENFERQLMQRLGEGARKDYPNNLVRQWRAGPFKIELSALTSVTSGSGPQTKEASSIPCRSVKILLDVSHVNPYPRGDLDWIVESLNGSESTPHAIATRVPLSENAITSLMRSRCAFRNTDRFKGLLDPNEIIVWKNAALGILGISHAHDSIIAKGDATGVLRLVKLRPGDRGNGGSQLSVAWDGIEGVAKRSLALLWHSAFDTLEAPAARIADIWGMRLEVAEEEDY
ncbi:MAG: hypothetical protein KDD69_05005 [Bdellovibrionales bacterium]|nr:hypothetical protein [Bdellovibrionales bacterium]